MEHAQRRFFDDRDAADATPVVIINETMAKRSAEQDISEALQVRER